MLLHAGWSFLLVVMLFGCSDKDVQMDADTTDTADATDSTPPPRGTSASATNETDSTAMKASSDRIVGLWELVAFASGDATALNDDLPDVEVTASFASDGSVSGRSGCNRYSVSIDFTDAGMQVGPVAGTKMACPGVRMEIEQAYTQALTSAREYEQEGDTLTLMGEDGTPLLRFGRVAEQDGANTSETGGDAGE